MTQTAPTTLIEGGDPEYFKFPAISSSKLKEWLKSPKHFFEYEPKERTKAMEFGAMLHDWMLYGRGYFHRHYMVLPHRFDGRTKEGKKLMEECREKGLTPVKDEDWGKLLDIESVFRGIPAWKRAMNQKIEIEQGFSWKHESGLTLKCKPDLLYKGKESGLIRCFDLKKTQNASQRGFINANRDYKYDIQAALYSMGLKARFGNQFDGFYFVFVEEKHPHGIGIYNFPDYHIQAVENWINQTLWEIHEIKAKDLPVYGYSNPEINDGVQEVEMPDYLYQRYLDI